MSQCAGGGEIASLPVTEFIWKGLPGREGVCPHSSKLRSSSPCAIAGCAQGMGRQDSCNSPLLVLFDPYPGREAQPL